MITIDELKAKLGGMKTAVDDLREALSIEASEKRLAELEHQMTMPGFYDDQERSQKIISEMGEVKNKLERFGKLSTQYEEAETLLEMIEEENDPALAAEGEEAVNAPPHRQLQRTESALCPAGRFPLCHPAGDRGYPRG